MTTQRPSASASSSNHSLKQAYIYALSAVALWSTVATAFKVALQFLSPVVLLWLATLSSLIFYALVISYQKRWHELCSWRAKDWLFSLLLALINPFGYYLILFNAYDRLPAQEASTLNYSWPIVLVVLSAIVHKRPLALKSILALFICFVGALVIASQGNILALQFSDKLGVFLAIISTVLWASFWLLNQQDDKAATLRLFSNFIFGLGLLSLYIVLSPSYTQEIKHLSMPAIASGLYVGLFEMGITFLLWRNALKSAGNQTAQVSILIYIIPFISLWIIQAVLNEAIKPSTLIGLIFIIIGIFLQRSVKEKQ